MHKVFDTLGIPRRSVAEADTYSYNNCFNSLQLQLRTVFIVTIIKNIPELVMPYIKMRMKK